MKDEQESLRFPIGRFSYEGNPAKTQLEEWTKSIESLPQLLEKELSDFNDEMLDVAYRTDGWTARQVFHHIADSHMNALIRFKLTLSEEVPVIKPYLEHKWALQADMKMNPKVSVDLLKSLHQRWVVLIRSLGEEELNRRYSHPESGREFTLKEAIALYAWHGRHHMEHIRSVKRKFAKAKV